MRFKLFRGVSDAGVQQAVNNWLAQLPTPPIIRISETSFATIDAGGQKVPSVTISVWYDEGF
jgi:hypothetical protein